MWENLSKIFFLFLCIARITVYSQTLSYSEIAKKTDALFSEIKKDQPGCSVGIMVNDSLIFAKGYGLANMEYDIPNTPKTIFDIASMSKQFTAYCIMLLYKAGKLNLTDDFRKHLTWFPDLKEKITIQNLLNHTSGIREQGDLLAVKGKLNEDTPAPEFIDILKKQTGLNFKPGSRYTYSNTNYFLLAEIVKTLSHQTLRKFADSAIFKPLKMEHTFFSDYSYEIIKNKACTYDRMSDTSFEVNIPGRTYPGPSALNTSIEDILKWCRCFYSPTKGDAFSLLSEQQKFGNGIPMKYANGIEVTEFRGQKILSHGGGYSHYRSLMIIIPTLKASIVAFSNNQDNELWRKLALIADWIIPEEKEKPKQIDSSIAVIKNIQPVKKYIGNYISETGFKRSVVLQNDKLYLITGEYKQLMFPEKNGAFSVLPHADALTPRSVSYFFIEDPVTKTITLDRLDLSKPPVIKYEEKKYSPEELKKISGTYYCAELDTKFPLQFSDGKLILKYSKGDIPLQVIGPGYLFAQYCYVLLYNEKDEIIGFEMNSERMRHVKFTKIE